MFAFRSPAPVASHSTPTPSPLREWAPISVLRRSRFAVAMFSAVVFIACSDGDDDPEGPNTTPDSGITASDDAGPSTDAGETDAGIASGDAGNADSGVGGVDAGVQVANTAFLRIAHVASTAGRVDVYLDDEATPRVSVDAFAGTDYVLAPAGQRTIRVAESGQPSSSAVVTATVALAENSSMSVALYDDEAQPTALILSDVAPTASSTQATWNVVHVASEVGPVTLTRIGPSTNVPIVEGVRLNESATVAVDASAVKVGIDVDQDAEVDVLFSVPEFSPASAVNVYVAVETPASDAALSAHLDDGTLLRVPACRALPQSSVVPLASTMTSTSRIAEFNITTSLAEIGFGDGSAGDGDGLYDVNDPSVQLGGDVDVFPREEQFVVGEIAYVADEATGCGIETLGIETLDLMDLWNDTGAVTDISSAGLDLWFFGAPLSLTFGALDESDTVTFTDGALSSIDLQVEMVLTIDYTFAGNPTTYTGELRIEGNRVSLLMDDTQLEVPTALGIQPLSRMVFALTGQVDAVNP